MKRFSFVALSLISYASFNQVYGEQVLAEGWGNLWEVYKSERDEKIDELKEQIKSDLKAYIHKAARNRDPQSGHDPFDVFKEAAASATLMQHLYKHEVKGIAELAAMSAGELKNTAANFLKDREYYPNIPYHHLTAEELNYVFDVADQQDYLCELYLKIAEQYQPIYKALDDMPQCSVRVQRTDSSPQRAKVILEQINKIHDPTSKKALQILDAGSSMGYVANYVADNSNHHVQGIDFLDKNNYVANLIALKEKLSAQFKTAEVSKELIRDMLPEYDVMFYLSILHHINLKYKEQGTKYTSELIRMSLDKVPFIILELAHQGETVGYEWKKWLPADVMANFQDLPENAYELHHIQDFETHLSPVPRPLYLLERKYITVNSHMYLYNKIFFEAHEGVHQNKYKTIARYYHTSDGKHFIKESVEKGNTIDFRKVLDLHLKHFSASSKIAGVPKLLDYELSQDGKHYVAVFEKAPGELLHEVAKGDTKEVFKAVDAALKILVALDANGLAHGDIRPWNVMWDKATSKASLIDFDHAYEVSNKKESLEETKAALLWLLKSLNDKKTHASAEVTKAPKGDAAEVYGPFACIAEDVKALAGGLSKLQSYSFDGTNCSKSDKKSDL